MRDHKHTDRKSAERQPPRNPGRDFHSHAEKQVRDAKPDPHKSHTGGGPKASKHDK